MAISKITILLVFDAVFQAVPLGLAQVTVYVTAFVVFGESKVENETGTVNSTPLLLKLAFSYCGVSLRK